MCVLGGKAAGERLRGRSSGSTHLAGSSEINDLENRIRIEIESVCGAAGALDPAFQEPHEFTVGDAPGGSDRDVADLVRVHHVVHLGPTDAEQLAALVDGVKLGDVQLRSPFVFRSCPSMGVIGRRQAP